MTRVVHNCGLIPVELRALPQWVVWRIVERDGNPTKPPFNPRNGALARTHDQEGKSYKDRPQDTWCDFETALHTFHSGSWAGLGFVFTHADPYVGIDIDDCMTSGRFNDQAKEIIRLLNSYTERSPSKSGVHIILRGSLPPGGRRKGSVELYDAARYFTFTGDVPNKCCGTIEDRQDKLEEVHKLIFGAAVVAGNGHAGRNAPFLLESDTDLLEKARNAKNSSLFYSLYDSGNTSHYGGDDSRADLALCDLLAFWTGPDSDRIDRLFRGSALYRSKWDRADYSRRTIEKALACKTDFYDPKHGGGVILTGYKTTSSSVNEVGELTTTDRRTEEELRPTESGSADRVVSRHGDDMRHAYNENIWYTWNGKRWVPRSEGRALAIVEMEMRSLWDEARTTNDDERRKSLGKYALRTESNRYVRAVLDMMRRRTQIMVETKDFDADPFLLNCVNGTLDLRTLTLREHRREDLLTKFAGCEFDQFATAPAWNRFVERVLPDEDIRLFVQRACGYALTADTTEQCFFFMHGDGCNGKSTFTELMLNIMGDYGMRAAPDLLISHKGGERVPTDVAELEGKRFVAAIEIDEGKRLAEGLIKQMTGGDRMKARYMRQDFFEFEPSHKIFMAANHRPVIRGTDVAIWRRVMLVPFGEHITDEEKDPHLAARLRLELPGILTWCVQGCDMWQEAGLKPPPQVIAATEEYRSEQDTIGRFISECCDLRGSVKMPELVECYRQWCHANGEIAMNTNVFSRYLTFRGFEARRDETSRIRCGLTLTHETRRFLEPQGGIFS